MPPTYKCTNVHVLTKELNERLAVVTLGVDLVSEL